MCLSALAVGGRAPDSGQEESALQLIKSKPQYQEPCGFSVFGSSPGEAWEKRTLSRRSYFPTPSPTPSPSILLQNAQASLCTHLGRKTRCNRGCMGSVSGALDTVFSLKCANCEVPSRLLPSREGRREAALGVGEGWARPWCVRPCRDGAARHSDRGRGSLRPCQSKPARSALLPLSFLKPVLGSSNALKGPGKLSTAPDQTTGRHADCFCFVLVFLSPLLQVKRSCQSRSHPGARRESAEPGIFRVCSPGLQQVDRSRLLWGLGHAGLCGTCCSPKVGLAEVSRRAGTREVPGKHKAPKTFVQFHLQLNKQTPLNTFRCHLGGLEMGFIKDL